MHFDDTDSVVDVNDALFLDHYIAGAHTFARSISVPGARPDAPLLPPGVSADRVAVTDGVRSVLAFGPGWALRAVRWADGHAQVTVTATSEALAQKIAEAATAGGRWASTSGRPSGATTPARRPARSTD
jgi:hypothetical protein